MKVEAVDPRHRLMPIGTHQSYCSHRQVDDRRRWRRNNQEDHRNGHTSRRHAKGPWAGQSFREYY